MSVIPRWSPRQAHHRKSATSSFALVLFTALFAVLTLAVSVTAAQSVSPGTAQAGQTVTVNIPATNDEFATCTINGTQYGAYSAQSVSYTIPAGTPPGTHTVGTCSQGGLSSTITVQVSQPPPPDSDGDGIPDSQDACPNVPYQGGNGCPPQQDGDDDQDGFPNSQDACPSQGDQGFGMQNNGCPNPPPQQQQPTTPPQQPTAVPPTSIPLATLPDDGTCYVATLSGGFVNVRDTASISGAAFGRMNPSIAYPASQAQNDEDDNVWYYLDDFDGWVAGYVTRQTTPCFSLPVAGAVIDSTGGDRDGDGVADANDACPDEFGFASDIAEINGCPLTTYAAPGYVIPDYLLDAFDQCPILLQTAEALPGFVIEEFGGNSADICSDTGDLSSVLLAYDYDDNASRLGDAGLYMIDNCPSLYFTLLESLVVVSDAEADPIIDSYIARHGAGDDVCSLTIGFRFGGLPGTGLAIRDIASTCGFTTDRAEALYELLDDTGSLPFEPSYCGVGTLMSSITGDYAIALRLLAARCGATTAAALSDAAAIVRYAMEAGVSARDLLARASEFPCDVAGATAFIDDNLASSPVVDARDPLVPPQLSDCPALSRALQSSDVSMVELIAILNSADPCAAAQVYLDSGTPPTDFSLAPEAELCFERFLSFGFTPSIDGEIRLSDGTTLDEDSSWAEWMSILHLHSSRWCSAVPTPLAEPVGDPVCYGIHAAFEFIGDPETPGGSFSLMIRNRSADGSATIHETDWMQVVVDSPGVHAASFSAWVQDRSPEYSLSGTYSYTRSLRLVEGTFGIAPQDDWYCRTGFSSIDVAGLPPGTILHGDEDRPDRDGDGLPDPPPSEDDDGIVFLIPDRDIGLFIPRSKLPESLFPDDDTPPTDGDTPPTDGDTPPTDGDTPPADGDTPPADGDTPPADGDTPPADGDTPPADGDTPPADGDTPPADGDTPPADGDTPPADPGTTVIRPEPGGPVLIVPSAPTTPGYTGRRTDDGVPVPYAQQPASSNAVQIALDPDFDAANFGNVQAAFEVLDDATGRSTVYALIDGDAVQLTLDDGVSNFTNPALDSLGKRVVYLRTDDAGNITLETMRIIDRRRIAVSVMADGAQPLAYTPAWSPDENAVYITMQYDEGSGPTSGIYQVDLTAPDQARAERMVADGYQPAANQNGTVLSFVRQTDGTEAGQEVFLYTRRNEREALLTDSLYGCHDPQFTDDFVRMYMTCNDEAGIGQLHRYDLNGLTALEVRSDDGTIDRAVNAAIGPNALMIGFDNSDRIYWGLLIKNVYRPLIVIDNGVASNVSFRALAPADDVAGQ